MISLAAARKTLMGRLSALRRPSARETAGGPRPRSPAATGFHIGPTPDEIVAASFGIYVHAILAGHHARTYRQVLKRDDWTCHRCDVRIPGAMEIDHLSGDHSDNTQENLAAICSFCHLGRHPSAAAAEERFTPIWFPELTQEEVNRLAWAHLAASGLSSSDNMRRIYDEFGVALEERQEVAETMLGLDRKGPYVEAFVETLFSARMLLAPEHCTRMSGHLRKELRYWPTDNILVWRSGKSVNVRKDLVERLVDKDGPYSEVNIEQLVSASKDLSRGALDTQTRLARRATAGSGRE